MVEVVIVGAGAAGISAGRELMSRGLSVLVLEAQDRTGGRAFTDRFSLPGHWDQGAQWFHSANVNPLVPLAKAEGWDFETEDRIGSGSSFARGALVDPLAAEAEEQALEAGTRAVYSAGQAGRDIPVAEAMAAQRQASVDRVFRLMSSEDSEKVSAQGYADYADTGVNWIVTQGMGALIERLAQGLPVRTGVAVRAIAETPTGVRIETSGGVVEAKAVIVTAATNLILSGAIHFASASAMAVLDQMQGLPCGDYEKLALACDRLPFDPEGALFCDVTLDDGMVFGFQTVTGPAPKLIAHFGGSDARRMAAMSLEEAAARAKDAVAAAFGSSASRSVTAFARTGWAVNPWVRGAYSYARVGAGTARKTMIATAAETGPIRFAGEAFSLPWHSTVHGAWTSGHEVAQDLAMQLGVAHRT